MCVRPQPTQQQHYRKPSLQTRPCYAKANSSLITSTSKMRRDIFPTIINSRVHPHQYHSHQDRGKNTRAHTRVISRRVSMERRRNPFSIKINKTTRKSSRSSPRVFFQMIPSSFGSEGLRRNQFVCCMFILGKVEMCRVSRGVASQNLVSRLAPARTAFPIQPSSRQLALLNFLATCTEKCCLGRQARWNLRNCQCFGYSLE